MNTMMVVRLMMLLVGTVDVDGDDDVADGDEWWRA